MIKRRQVIGGGVACLGGGFLGGEPADLEKAKLASEMNLKVALIGAGWYGKVDTLKLIEIAPVEVVAVAEVDQRLAAKAAQLISEKQLSKKRPRIFSDYRKMLKAEKYDVVIIGTPDHWHCLPMIAAVEAGADVYVQKPTGVDVRESQAMLAAAKKHDRVVQVGTQRRSTAHLIEAKREIIESGKLGEVAQVEGCCYYHMRNKKRPEQAVAEVPAELDWEMWTGPAPMRPYNNVVHTRGWRSFMEYSNGIVGDMCVHMLDTARWMLGLGWPKSVSSEGGILVDPGSVANITDTQTAVFDFGKLQFIWRHRSWGAPVDPKWPWAVTFYGTKGTLKAGVDGYEFVPRGKGQVIEKKAVTELEKFPGDKGPSGGGATVGPAIREHMRDFLKAVAERGRPVADIEQGHISSASCILANNAQTLGRTLEWNEKSGEVRGDDEANALLARPYREGWERPVV